MHQDNEQPSERRSPRTWPTGSRIRRLRRLGPRVWGARAVLTTCAVISLGIVGAATAAAAPGSAQRAERAERHLTDASSHVGPAVMGRVVAVGGSTAVGTCGAAGGTGTFTLADGKGSTITIDVSSNTQFLDRAVTTSSFADVCVGSRAVVPGLPSGGALAAGKVTVLVPRRHRAPALAGTVSSVDGSAAAATCGTAGGVGTFTLDVFGGSPVSVDVASGTTFGDRGHVPTTLADVCVGTALTVVATPSAGGGSTAVEVRVRVAHHDDAASGASGASGSSGAAPSDPATQSGTGSISSAGTTGVTAHAEGKSDAGPPAGAVVGRVTDTSASSITLSSDGDPVTVGITASTTFDGASGPLSLAALHIGDTVHVVGTVTGGLLVASSVTVVTAEAPGPDTQGAWGGNAAPHSGGTDGGPTVTIPPAAPVSPVPPRPQPPAGGGAGALDQGGPSGAGPTSGPGSTGGPGGPEGSGGGR